MNPPPSPDEPFLPTRRANSARIGPAALLAVGAVALGAGMLLGLNIARLLTVPPGESRLLMQMLAHQQATLVAEVSRNRCSVIPEERLQAIAALVELIPASLRDSIVLDQRFTELHGDLRKAMEPLRSSAAVGDCGSRDLVLDAIDGACRDCHEEYRTGSD